jgi:hypothetical protein
MSGNVVIKPLTAKLTRNTEFFGKMDPLVKVIIGAHTQRTAVAKRGHKNPGWETELSLRRSFEDIIHFEVWDKDIIKGDLVGMGDIAFNQIFVLGNKFNGWIPLKYKGKDSGELLVDILFIPDAGVNTTDMLVQSMQQSTLANIQQQQQYQQQQPLQSSSQQLQSSQQMQSTPQAQSILVSRPPTEETPRSQLQNLPEPTFIQNTPTKVSQMPVTYSTPYEKVTTTQSVHYGHANCSAFHETRNEGEGKRDFKEIESQLLPKSETQGFGDKKPMFQSNLRGDTDNPNLGLGGQYVSGLKS